jgi:hypothetical protein
MPNGRSQVRGEILVLKLESAAPKKAMIKIMMNNDKNNEK